MLYGYIHAFYFLLPNRGQEAPRAPASLRLLCICYMLPMRQQQKPITFKYLGEDRGF